MWYGHAKSKFALATKFAVMQVINVNVSNDDSKNNKNKNSGNNFSHATSFMFKILLVPDFSYIAFLEWSVPFLRRACFVLAPSTFLICTILS